MQIDQYVNFLERSWKHKRTVLGVGAPGVGKTYAWYQAAGRLGMDCIVMSAPLESPDSIRGYPARDAASGRATHTLFDGMARAMDAKVPTFVGVDDLGMAMDATLRSVLRFFQFREVDGRKLPDYVVLGAATNDVGHGAGVYGMLEPLKTRFDSIVNVETSVDAIVPYGLSRGWPVCLLGYLRNNPDALHDWKPSKSMHVDGACPRGWEHVAEWVNEGELDHEVIGGAVGKGQATAYLAFRRIMKDLPDVAAILMDPDNTIVPENPDARWMVSMALASQCTCDTFGAVVRYLGRIEQNLFKAFAIRSAFRSEAMKQKEKRLPAAYKPISASRDFVAWAVTDEGKDIISAVKS